MSATEATAPNPFRWEILLLFQAALAIFVFTVVVGVLNGADVTDFEHRTLMTHVHTGTLGWLTLSVFGASLWLFSHGAPLSAAARWSGRVLAWAAVVSFLAYNYAFLTTYGVLRPQLGGVALAVIIGFLVWVALRARVVELTTPHIGILAAVGTSVIGGVIGVLWGILIATGRDVLPDGGEDAHPATMVIGFLIPVGMALAEWAFVWPRPERVTRLGVLQMALPFFGGLLVMAGLLLDIIPLVALSLPFELAAVGIFVRRMWPYLRQFTSMDEARTRFAAASAVWIPINIVLFVYLVAVNEGDLDKAPSHEILAMDHVMFIGVMTNVVFALLLSTLERSAERWPAADHLVFWCVNIGLIGFALGLFYDETLLKRLFTPLLGAGLLLMIATLTARLQARDAPALAAALRRSG